MHSTIGIDVAAPADLVFRLARDVERWERLLPHYARSRARERLPDGSLVADFIARRPLIGVLGLGLPVTWRSRTWSEPETRRLRFVHVAGATRGMDVTWRIEPTTDGCRVDIDHDFRPRLPAPGRHRRPLVHATDRRPDAGHVQGAGRGAGRRRAVRPGPRDEPIDMTARRRVWITGIGVITPDRDRARGLPGGAAGRALPGEADRPVRCQPVPLAGGRAGRRLRPARLDAGEDRPPARPVQPVRPGRRTARARGRRARPGRARRGRTRTDRDLPRVGARWHRLRRGPARALPRQGHPPGRPEPRARRVRRGGAGQPRHRAGRSRSRSSRRPTRAHRDRSRSARRSATCARAGSTRPSPAAARSRSARSPSARSTSSGRCRPVTTTRRAPRPGRSTSAATGSSWARAPRCSCSRTPRPQRRAARRRTRSCSATAPRPTPITWSSRGPTVARPRAPRRSRSRMPASTRARSTTSTPTRPRRRSATSPRRGRSRRPSASARRPSR